MYFPLFYSDDAVWHDVLLLLGEPDDGKPGHVQQLPQTDGLVETCCCPPQDHRLPEEALQHQLVDCCPTGTNYSTVFERGLRFSRKQFGFEIRKLIGSGISVTFLRTMSALLQQ